MAKQNVTATKRVTMMLNRNIYHELRMLCPRGETMGHFLTQFFTIVMKNQNFKTRFNDLVKAVEKIRR